MQAPNSSARATAIAMMTEVRFIGRPPSQRRSDRSGSGAPPARRGRSRNGSRSSSWRSLLYRIFGSESPRPESFGLPPVDTLERPAETSGELVARARQHDLIVVERARLADARLGIEVGQGLADRLLLVPDRARHRASLSL